MELPSHMDRVKGLVNPEDYAGSNLSLEDFEIDLLLDDTILVKYVDGNSEEKNVGGIIVQQAVTKTTWRVGQILLAGVGCKEMKDGDYVLFPNDKGMPAKDITFAGEKHKEVIFLSEARIFGRLAKKGE